MMQRNLTVMMLMLLASTAHAEPAPKQPETTSYEFGDDLVRGDLLRPEGAVLQARGRSHRSSLIDVRATFMPELLKSVESL